MALTVNEKWKKSLTCPDSSRAALSVSCVLRSHVLESFCNPERSACLLFHRQWPQLSVPQKTAGNTLVVEGLGCVSRCAENTAQSAPWGVSVGTLRVWVWGSAAEVAVIQHRATSGVLCAVPCPVCALPAVCELVQQEVQLEVSHQSVVTPRLNPEPRVSSQVRDCRSAFSEASGEVRVSQQGPRACHWDRLPRCPPVGASRSVRKTWRLPVL